VLAAGAVMLTMMALTSLDVLGRALFNSPVPGTVELMQMMLVAAIFLSISYVQALKQHIRVEFLLERLPVTARRALVLAGLIIGIAVFGVFSWRASLVAWQAWAAADFQEGALNLPLWPAKMLVPLGSGMLTVRFVLDLLEVLGRPDGD
jgi:TRAP-type C4-dicarboxylate transport system permease small subunit